MTDCDVLIVGGGVAGLACARELESLGVDWRLVEGADALGGRVRTDVVDGYRLDRGFQVFLEAYPEARRLLDYSRLRLRPFEAGARVRVGDDFATLADPFRTPRAALSTAFAPIGSLRDKLLVARLRRVALRGSLADLFHRADRSTIEELRLTGFSERMIEAFFRPYLGGVFLDPELATSSRMMYFVLRMMARGRVSLPALGMEEIVRQLAAPLPIERIRVNARVRRLHEDCVELESGERLSARRIVLAGYDPAFAVSRAELTPAANWRSARCLYFGAERPPLAGAWLTLGGARSIVSNLVVLSEVAPEYAPRGRALVSVTVLEPGRMQEGELEAAVRRELRAWFGPSAARWEYLRSYSIPRALPLQTPGFRDAARRLRRPSGRYLFAGDHTEYGALNGAMSSGRRAARQTIAACEREALA